MRKLRNLKRRTVVILATFVVVALAAVAGAAYLAVSSGSGTATGSNTVGNPPAPIPVTLTGSFDSGLLSGPGTTTPVNYQAKSAVDVTIGTIHAVVVVDPAHASAGCLATWFSIPDRVVNRLQGGSPQFQDVPGNPSILSFNDAGASVNQNACGGATLTLNLTSN